jgi:hypothetical protein
MNYVIGFTLFMAGIVSFKLIFSLLYCLKWNVRQCCCPYYKKSSGNVADEFRRLRKDKKAAYSSDEDEDENLFNTDEEGNPIVVAETVDNNEIDDSDNDDVEFEDPREEEIHDKTLETIWRSKALEISKATIGKSAA